MLQSCLIAEEIARDESDRTSSLMIRLGKLPISRQVVSSIRYACMVECNPQLHEILPAGPYRTAFVGATPTADLQWKY